MAQSGRLEMSAICPLSWVKRTSASDCLPITIYELHALVQERPARFLPGVDAALDVTGGGETRILRRLHRHGRAFPEGAVENDALASGAREFIEHAARTDIGREIGVGGVQRAGDDAVLLAFAPLPQVDERHVGPAVERKRFGGAHRPAADEGGTTATYLALIGLDKRKCTAVSSTLTHSGWRSMSAGYPHLARRLSGPALERMRECAHLTKTEQPRDLGYVQPAVIEVTNCQIAPQLLKYFSEVQPF